MTKKTWNVDARTVVNYKFSGFGKRTISVNDRVVSDTRRWRAKGDIPFVLPDGRKALLTIRPQFVGVPQVELKVGNQLMIETGKKPIQCLHCRSTAQPYDKFCGNCGKALPDVTYYLHQNQLQASARVINWLAVLYLVFGVVFFFSTKAQSDNGLAQLAGMAPDATFPRPIHGVTMTVGALRDRLAWEPWSVLIMNGILAVTMLGLSIWGRRSPLPALIAAAAVYAVVNVGNAIIDPASIGQGLFMKIVVFALLARGIKSALALRTAVHG